MGGSTFSVEFALLLWIIILVSVFFILKAYRITWWSSLVFALFVSWILLSLSYPFHSCLQFDRRQMTISYPEECDDEDCDRHGKHKESKNIDGIFFLISFVTIIIVIVYLIQKVFRDREDYTPHQQKTMSPYQY